jgi:hypothetical protein
MLQMAWDGVLGSTVSADGLESSSNVVTTTRIDRHTTFSIKTLSIKG